jgi:hypothetical protein
VKEKVCEWCGQTVSDFGRSFENHEAACEKFQEMAENFLKLYPRPKILLKDIFRKDEIE